MHVGATAVTPVLLQGRKPKLQRLPWLLSAASQHGAFALEKLLQKLLLFLRTCCETQVTQVGIKAGMKEKEHFLEFGHMHHITHQSHFRAAR